MQKIDSIAERYCTSKPVSGDWNTEVSHEISALMQELGSSYQDAVDIMINYLGFSPDDTPDQN